MLRDVVDKELIAIRLVGWKGVGNEVMRKDDGYYYVDSAQLRVTSKQKPRALGGLLLLSGLLEN